jgi:hypothetical protein
LTAYLGVCSAAGAQQANPLDVIPDKMPFAALWRADFVPSRSVAIAACAAEAEKRGWALNVAVVDSGANWSPSRAWMEHNSARSPSSSTRRARA